MIMDVFSGIYILMFMFTWYIIHMLYTTAFRFYSRTVLPGQHADLGVLRTVAEAMSIEVFNMHVWHCLFGSPRLTLVFHVCGGRSNSIFLMFV